MHEVMARVADHSVDAPPGVFFRRSLADQAREKADR
jgi:hypothetical protein